MNVRFEKLDKNDWESLHELCMSIYLEGSCYEFACAVHRGTGWPLIGIMQGAVIRHAGVTDSQGKFIDSRGVVDTTEIGKPFDLKPPYTTKEITEEDLRATRPVNDRGISRASLMAEALWPAWPWKQDTFRSRALAFLSNLDLLCKKHDVWIRGGFPTSPIVLDQRMGDERFKVSPALTGQYLFDRELVP